MKRTLLFHAAALAGLSAATPIWILTATRTSNLFLVGFCLVTAGAHAFLAFCQYRAIEQVLDRTIPTAPSRDDLRIWSGNSREQREASPQDVFNEIQRAYALVGNDLAIECAKAYCRAEKMRAERAMRNVGRGASDEEKEGSDEAALWKQCFALGKKFDELAGIHHCGCTGHGFPYPNYAMGDGGDDGGAKEKIIEPMVTPELEEMRRQVGMAWGEGTVGRLFS